MPKIEKDLLKVKGSDGQWHYVPAVGGSVDTSPTWDAVQNKPFSTLGSGLSVDENGVLSAQGGGSGSANAVQYVAQTLTDEQKAQARENIGAGTSSFSGSYNDLTSKPTIPTQVTIDSTLKQSGQAADAKTVGDALATKLDKNQGTTNAGKILGIGEDGIVVPQDKPTGSTVTVDSELSTTSENPVQNKVVTAALTAKVNLPTNEDGTPNYGTVGYYAVSDGEGSITWVKSAPSTGGGETTTHGIVWDLVNVTSSNNSVSVADGASLVAVLTPADGYTLGDVIVTMGGEALTGVWDANTSTVTIASVTGDVVISCAGVEQGTGEVVDTSPVIAQTDYAYHTASTTRPSVKLRASSGQCVTKIYEFTPDVAAIEANSNYDADLGYINSAYGMAGFWCYIPSAKYIAAGNTEKANAYKKAAYFVDGVLQTTLYSNLTHQSSEGFMAFGADKNALQKTVNGIAFTLYTADAEDSYAYWTKKKSDGTYKENAVLPIGVNDGDIIFAGKNTPYYGMKNIYGTTAGDTASELSVDDDYAQNYGVATASVLGEDVEDSAEYGISAEFAAVIDNARKAWMTEYNGDYRKIPLIAHTDQHGRLSLATSHKLFKYLGATVNWYSVSKVMNLGDTVSVEWYDADKEKPLLTCTQLEEAAECLKPIPFSKRLEVFGNHDTWYGDYATDGNTIGTRYPSTQAHLEQYFRNIYARRTNNNGWFVVHDDSFNVKYVVISGFEYNGNVAFRIGTKQMEFIVDELGKDDGYDIVIMSHVPIYYAVDTTVYPTGMTDANVAGYMLRVAEINTDALFNARKNKTSGTVTDSDGVEHTFDFSNCTTDILCNLSGHMHIDGYNYVSDANDGLLSVTLDKFVDGCIHFVLVDRENRRVNVWKISNPDDTPQCVNYQIPLDKPTA